MSLAARSTAKPPHASSHRLRSIAEQRATPDDMLGTAFVQAVEAKVETIVQRLVPQIIDGLIKNGYRPPTPSEAYIPEKLLREHLGKRKDSPMSPQTFRADWIDTAKIIRVPVSVTGNGRDAHIWFTDVEKHFPHLVEKLQRKIIQPSHLRK